MMANEKQELTISFRLGLPQAEALRRLAEKTRSQSLHELARTLLIFALEQQPAWDEVKQTRADIHDLRTALARSVEALLLNASSDLDEAEIKRWVFDKLWPQAK